MSLNRAYRDAQAAEYYVEGIAEPITHHPEVVTLEWSRRWPCEEIWKARKQ